MSTNDSIHGQPLFSDGRCRMGLASLDVDALWAYDGLEREGRLFYFGRSWWSYFPVSVLRNWPSKRSALRAAMRWVRKRSPDAGMVERRDAMHQEFADMFELGEA